MQVCAHMLPLLRNIRKAGEVACTAARGIRNDGVLFRSWGAVGNVDLGVCFEDEGVEQLGGQGVEVERALEKRMGLVGHLAS